MGMDVSGRRPASEKGEYFRASVWSWHPLWDYCEELEPELCDSVRSPHTNDGDGLKARDAKLLGIAILAAVGDGRAAKYIAAQEKKVAKMPDKKCDLCAGTGRRAVVPKSGAGPHGCNGCGGDYGNPPEDMGKAGTGKVRPFETNYSFDLDHLREFGEFCCASGGFRIW